jgi:hypothetical protein
LYRIIHIKIYNFVILTRCAEIELPKGVPPPSLHEDNEETEEKIKTEDEWNDLALDHFLKE